MFGCCIPGRLLQTNFVQIDETHAALELPAPRAINHICVFLLGTIPFPDGFGATVHFHFPGKGFQVLGMLSNEKPSAIFRLRSAYTAGGASAFAALPAPEGTDPPAVLGIAIEPLALILQQVAPVPAPAPPVDAAALAERIGRHLMNYVGGFAGDGADTVVPVAVVGKWFDTFVAKVRAGGVGFLERGE